MRVLLYTHSFAPVIGGVETYVMLLARGLAQRAGAGHDVPEVTVVTPTPAGGTSDAVLSFPVVRGPGFMELLRTIKRTDVVHLAGPCLLPMLLAWALRKPIVVEHHGYQAACPTGLLWHEPAQTVCPGHFVVGRSHKCLQCTASTTGWMRSLPSVLLTLPRRWLCERVTRNLPIAHHVKDRLDLPRSEVIYYGIPDRSAVADAGGQIQPESSVHCPVTFAYVGRLVPEKGLHLLVEAAGRLQKTGCDFRIKFIGDGPERSRLQLGVETLGLGERVAFTGYLEGKALEVALQAVAAVVMPSVWEETAGLAAMEQMMRGRLVIAADIGGLGEVVGEAGLKFPPADPDALTSCMKRVLDEPDVVRTLGEKARARALKLFGEERMIAEHIALYRQVSGDSAPSSKSDSARVHINCDLSS